MGFIFSGTFWGVLLILLGISVLIKVFFQIDIPLVRGFFGLVIILIGLSILMGRPLIRGDANTVIFNEGRFNSASGQKPSSEYNVIFGSAFTDLSDISLDDSNVSVKVNTIFGENKIKINPALPLIIRSNAAFAEARLPGGNSAGFGNTTYQTPSYDSNKPHLILDVNVVFGSVKILTQ